MTLDDVSKLLMHGVSNLRADVRDNAILLEQTRDELRAVHKTVGGIEQHLADIPKRDEFDELRADVEVIKKVVGDHSGELPQLDSRGSTVEMA